MTIRRRILTLLLPTIAIALGVTAVVVDASVRSDLTRSLDTKLLTRARAVGAALEVRIDGELEFDLERSVAREFGIARGDPFFAIRAEDGRLLDSSSPDPPLIPDLTGISSPDFRTAEPKGIGPMRVCVLRLELLPDPDPEDFLDWRRENPGSTDPTPTPRVVWIEAGTPARELTAALASLRFRLGLGFGALLLALALLPILIVTRALRPVRVLCEEANAVSATDPHARLTEEGCDDEIRDLVVALNRALDRLGRALESQRRFTADAAHELRSPITAIRTRCEVTLRRKSDAGELRASLEAVHGTCLRLGQTIEGLLTLSRHDSTAAEFEDVDLASLAREAATIHQPLAEAKGVELSLDLPERVAAMGEPALLRECCAILLENAVRVTPGGGRIRMSCGNSTDSWVAVEDTGPGIPAEEIPRVFERFYQVDPSRSRSDGGAGLGLAIARSIAELHGASIEVRSTVGEGSRFELHLPHRGLRTVEHP